MIHVEGLTRRFGPVTAVSKLDFHLERGEVVGFLGPNGAGKTTTMRILAGYLPASEGRVEVAGLDVLRQSLAARRKIGYLPEAVPLYPEHRVTEMLAFQARLHGMRRADYRRRIPEVLARVGIDHRARSLIGRLSRGQRQRVGLAVALLPSPEVLILDEPTSGLDPLQRIEVRGLLRELADEHTVLISSHILPEIEAVCPRVMIIDEGRIVADGRPDELVRELGDAIHVRVEAVVGDPAEARRLLGALAGAGEVRDRGRLGIHHQFEVLCDEDLREDVGALAAQKGWALRELSFRRPTLEELFARIALRLDEGRQPAPGTPAPAAGAAPVATPAPASGPAGLTVLGAPGTPAPGAGEQRGNRAGQQVYNLNPFDQGATRDLGAPKTIEQPPLPADQQREAEGEAEGEALSGVLTVYRRELAGLFLRPLAWVLLVIALLYVGANLSLLIVPAVGGDVIQALMFGAGGGYHFWWLLTLLPPLITMRMISEEARSGLLEFLLTAPVRNLAVVLGKLGAATTFMTVLWAALPVYALVMEWLGTVPGGGPDWAPVWTGFLGAVLASGFFCAIGLVISAGTSTPLIAGFLSFVVNVFLIRFLPLFGSLGGLDPEHWFREVLAHFNVVSQLQGSFMLGVLDTRGVLFFLIWTAFFVFLATRLLEMRRWR